MTEGPATARGIPRLPWWRGTSVRSRILWTTTVVTAAAMALMAVVVVVIVARFSNERIDASLNDRIDATVASLSRTKNGSLRLRTGSDDVVDSVWVFDRNGTQVSGPAAGDHVQDVVDRLARAGQEARAQSRDRVYRARPVRLGGQATPAGVIVAAEDVQAYEGSRDLLIGGLALLGLLVVGVTAAVTGWTVTRTLAPVRRMTVLAATWSQQDLDSRFGLEHGRQDEFTRLGNTLDLLLDRVAEAIRGEQQLTAELAHELRTPLTSVRAEAELGLMAGVEDSARERLERILAQVDRLNDTIGTLLAVARHQYGAVRRCDLQAVVADLVEAYPREVSIGVEVVEPVSAAADAALAERVLAPVLDNAVRYAERDVRITLRRSGRDAVVDISDDGPGITDTEAAFRPGGVGEDSSGAGLGLPLARRVAASLGGSVSVHRSARPTVVRVTLPAR